MSTSRYGDCEWGEMFEGDELVDWPARDDLDEGGGSIEGGVDTFSRGGVERRVIPVQQNTALSDLDSQTRVEYRSVGNAAQSAADAAQDALQNQRENPSFVSSDEDAA